MTDSLVARCFPYSYSVASLEHYIDALGIQGWDVLDAQKRALKNLSEKMRTATLAAACTESETIQKQLDERRNLFQGPPSCGTDNGGGHPSLL